MSRPLVFFWLRTFRQVLLLLVLLYVLAFLFNLMLFFKAVPIMFYTRKSPMNYTTRVSFGNVSHLKTKGNTSVGGYSKSHTNWPYQNITRGTPLTTQKRVVTLGSESELVSLRGLEKKMVTSTEEQNGDIVRPSLSISTSKTGQDVSTSDATHVDKFAGYVASYFNSSITKSHSLMFINLLKVFDETMGNLKELYFLYGGTLIGSFRHHGMIPWDDDLDVIVPSSSEHILHTAFSKLKPDFVLNTDQGTYWKLYASDADPIAGYNWKWPFLDIFFYDENETDPRKYDVFPERRKPFMGLFLLTHRDPSIILQQYYNIDMCDTGDYVHRVESLRKRISIPCSLLHSIYPFVKRVDVVGGCNETLEVGGKIISYFLDNGFRCYETEFEVTTPLTK